MSKVDDLPPLVAICDSLVLMSAIMADEDAYLKKKLKARFQIDTNALPTFAAASLIFDEFTSLPVIGFGLKPIIGFNFLELFGSTLTKLSDSGLVRFDLEARVPYESRNKLQRITEFLTDVQNTEKVVNLKAGRFLSDPFANTLEQDFVYSHITNLPVIAPLMRLASPTVQTFPELRSQEKQFEILREVLTVEVPNFEVRTLNEILDIRRAYGAQEFRKVFRTFYHNLENSITEYSAATKACVMEKWGRLKNEAIDLLTTEFKSDIKGWSSITAGISIALDLAGFIPLVSMITSGVSAIKDTKELVNHLARSHRAKEFGWLYFLTDLRKNIDPSER